MIELSKYILKALHQDDEFVLYRGRSKEGESRALVLSPVAEYPAPEILKRLEHEYSLREELDPTWMARPMAMAHHWNRPALAWNARSDPKARQPAPAGYGVHKNISRLDVLVNDVALMQVRNRARSANG